MIIYWWIGKKKSFDSTDTNGLYDYIICSSATQLSLGWLLKVYQLPIFVDARYKYFDYLKFRRKIIKIGRYLLEIYFIYQSPFSDSSILIFIKEMPKILRGYKPEEEAKDFLE